MTHRRAWLAIIGLAISVVCGCAVSDAETKKLQASTNFLTVGETKRYQVVKKYGKPTASFEDQRLLVYVFDELKDGPRKTMHHPSEVSGPQLVLEFDNQGVLRRYRTLQVP